ncbi:unnamed protein product [Caenorhabditis brenneri]
MINQSCADSEDLNYVGNANFLVSQFVDLIAIFSTFITTILAASAILQRSIFTLSTKILLIQNLIYGMIHQIFYGIESVELIYKNLYKLDKPCQVLQSEAQCAPYLELLFLGTSGMIYGQTALMVERAFATFLKSYEKPKSYIIGGVISVVLLISSASTGRLVIWDDPLKSYVIACFVSPSQSFERTNWFFNICSVLALFNLSMSVAIMRTRFKVRERFKKREVIVSTETICYLALIEFVLIVIYSVGVMILVNLWLKDEIPNDRFNFWIVWCYTIPFAAAIFPLVLIHRIRTTRALRVKKINDITHAKQTQEGHINIISAVPLMSTNNLTCASAHELARLESSNFVISQIVDLIAGIITLTFTYPAAQNYKAKKAIRIGSFISFLVFFCSLITPKLLLWDDPMDSALLGCFMLPRASNARSTVYFGLCTFLTLFNLTVSLSLKRYNKKLEYSTRFKVGVRFRKREAIDSTGTVCFLSLSLFILMFIYSVGVCVLRDLRPYITITDFYFWVVWFYTVPFFAMLLPILLIYRIRRTRSNRVHLLIGMSHEKYSQESHIKQMQDMWS